MKDITVRWNGDQVGVTAEAALQLGLHEGQEIDREKFFEIVDIQ